MSRGHSDCGRMIQILDSVWSENSSALERNARVVILQDLVDGARRLIHARGRDMAAPVGKPGCWSGTTRARTPRQWFTKPIAP
jgi:hypothetical protein